MSDSIFEFRAPSIDLPNTTTRTTNETFQVAQTDAAIYNTDASKMFGPKDQVDSMPHFLGTAFGFGGLPESKAVYLNFNPGLPVGAYKVDIEDVPVSKTQTEYKERAKKLSPWERF